MISKMNRTIYKVFISALVYKYHIFDYKKKKWKDIDTDSKKHFFVN